MVWLQAGRRLAPILFTHVRVAFRIFGILIWGVTAQQSFAYVLEMLVVPFPHHFFVSKTGIGISELTAYIYNTLKIIYLQRFGIEFVHELEEGLSLKEVSFEYEHALHIPFIGSG